MLWGPVTALLGHLPLPFLAHSAPETRQKTEHSIFLKKKKKGKNEARAAQVHSRSTSAVADRYIRLAHGDKGDTKHGSVHSVRRLPLLRASGFILASLSPCVSYLLVYSVGNSGQAPP